MKNVPFILLTGLLLCGMPRVTHAADRLPPNGLGVLSLADVQRSVQKQYQAAATQMAAAGAFQGFHAAPGSSLASADSLYDFLVQNVAIGTDGQSAGGTPLDAVRQRNFCAGDKLSYVMCDYPRQGVKSGGNALQHRYALPFAVGSDQTGASFPIVLGLRDLTSSPLSQEFNILGLRDITSMVGIFPGFGCYLGAYIPNKDGYVVSLGAGYANDAAEGMARFAHPLYPDPVPKLGSLWYAAVLEKTYSIGHSKEVDSFTAHRKNLLVPQFTVGQRLMYTYGTRDHQTKSLDTVVVVLAYNNVNSFGDAPIVHNPSGQMERIYLTKELGYATRWESWARVDNKQKDVLEIAKKAYAYNNGGLPASMEGAYSPHFTLGPVVEDKTLGVYKYDQTITDPSTGKKEITTWYMIGCHDYTNLQPQRPIDPLAIFSKAAIGLNYLKLFGVSSNAFPKERSP